ncbi:MAG: UbiA family prenyltransferase, partial [Campylobacter sp.]|nr:UbiA family prenyltransferase [Campylobacter sp.]
GLSPIAGAIAVLADVPLWVILLSCGVVFWVAGFDILYSLQDMDYDKKMGLFSIPSIYGAQASMFICALFHFLTILFWLLFAISAKLGIIGFIGVVVSGIILYLEHRIVRRDFSKIDRAFFTLNGYLGIIFFIFVLVSLW